MAKKASKTTALGLVEKASGLTRLEFSKVLGMEKRRVQSYILGTRELPPLSELSNIETFFGIDLESLKSKKPMMISGREATPELVQGWRKHGGISPEGAALACEQLMPTLSATITTLCAQDRSRGFLLLHRIQALLEAELKRVVLLEKVKEAVESTVLVTSSETYPSGADMLEKAPDLPTGHPRWAAFVDKMNRNIPVQVSRVSRPAFGLPIDKVQVTSKKKDSVGYRASRVIKKEIVITQAKKSHRFSSDYLKSKIASVSSH